MTPLELLELAAQVAAEMEDASLATPEEALARMEQRDDVLFHLLKPEETAVLDLVRTAVNRAKGLGPSDDPLILDLAD